MYITVIISAVIFQLVTMCVQIWAMSSYDITKEWYSLTSTGNAYFTIQYGPPKWLVLLVWILVFIYQILWTVYALSTLWRRSPFSKERLYYEPYFMPLSMYVAVLVNLIFRLSWSALLPNCSAICPVLQLGATLSITVAFIISTRALVNEAGALYRMGLSRDVTIVRALVHNGFAAYATWELIDLSICVSGVMVRDGYTQKESYATMLGVLGVIMIVFIMLDVPLLDVYLRYTVTPYIVASLYFISIIDAHSDSDLVYVIAAILLVIALLAFGFKIAFIVIKRRYSPEPISLTSSPIRQQRKSSNIATRVDTRMPIGAVGTITTAYM